MVGLQPGESPMADVDAANFVLERGQPNVVTLAGLLAPGGFVDADGMPDLAGLRGLLGPRVATVAALNRRPEHERGEWMWRPALPDLEHHIRTVAPEPAVGQARAVFERTCARVLMEPLAAGRPLWELLLVPKVGEHACGMLFRVHHAVADGLGVEALLGALADGPGEDGPGAEAHGGAGAEAGADVVGPELGARAESRTAPARRTFVQRAGDVAVQTAAVFRRTVRSRTLLGPLGATRDVAFLDVDLALLHDGAKRRGGTINDAFLAAFGQGIHALVRAAGERPPASVPVSNPVRLDRRGGEGNATGVMLIPVPVDDADLDRDPATAVARVAALTGAEKKRARAVGTFTFMSNPRAARLLMRFARTQRAVAAIASELTGPTAALRLGGAELVEAWPLSLLSGDVRIGALAVSYAGRFRVSLQTDAEHLPPARVAAAAMAAALHRIAD